MDYYSTAVMNCKELSLQGRLKEAEYSDLERYVDYFESQHQSFLGGLKLAFNKEYQKARKIFKDKYEEKKRAIDEALKVFEFY